MPRVLPALVAVATTCAVLAAGAASAGPAGAAPTGPTPQRVQPAATASAPVVVAAVGDISPQALGAQRQTAALAASWSPSAVLALGDLQYPKGSYTDFMRYYDPTWGRLKLRTRPVPGNHEYGTAKAAGYNSYFGNQAKPQGHTYYSYNLNGWHMVALNSELLSSQRSDQLTWLRADLRANRQRCVVAYWHRPRFSSGKHGSDPAQADFWNELYRVRADVVLAGHDHDYERFAPQTPTGVPGPTIEGMRQFVIGTGGAESYAFAQPVKNSQVRISGYPGVLKLSLEPGRYRWQFVSVDGQVRDSGTNACH